MSTELIFAEDVLNEAVAKIWISNRAVTLSQRSKSPLTEEQWAAIESVKPRRLWLHGNVLDDSGMARLVKLDPIFVGINENSILTGAGVASLEKRSR